jgi:hypothetical protein
MTLAPGVVRIMLQVVASLTIIMLMTLEVSFTLLENIIAQAIGAYPVLHSGRFRSHS